MPAHKPGFAGLKRVGYQSSSSSLAYGRTSTS